MIEGCEKPKAAVFVDISNIFFGSKNYAKWRIDYEKTKKYLESKYTIVFFRLYGCEDTNPSSEIFKIKAIKQQGFYAKLVASGFDIFKKPIQYIDGKIEGDVDDDIKNAIRQYINNDEIEYIVLFSGDKHFLPIIRDCYNAGKRTDIYSFRQTLSGKIKKFVSKNPQRCNFIYLNKKRKELEFINRQSTLIRMT